MRALLLLLGLVLTPGWVLAAENRVAVLEIGGDGEPVFQQTLTDTVREGVRRALGASYKVMTRETMDLIAADMGKDLACLEGECEVATGEMLGASLVVSGNLAEIEGEWVLTVKLHRVADRDFLGSTPPIRGRTQLVLMEQVADLTTDFIREKLRIRGADRAAPREIGGSDDDWLLQGRREAVLEFRSAPSGAGVSVDGVYLCSTPCSKQVAHGSRLIEFTLQKYDRLERTVTVRRNEAIEVELAPQFGWLSVDTNPSGLRIRVDGEDVGRSPLRRLEVPPGRREVVIHEGRWQRSGRDVDVVRGEHAETTLRATAILGGLAVTAEDEVGNALVRAVYVDDSKVGETPYGPSKLQVGEYLVRVEGERRRVVVSEREVRNEHFVVRVRSAERAPPARFADPDFEDEIEFGEAYDPDDSPAAPRTKAKPASKLDVKRFAFGARGGGGGWGGLASSVRLTPDTSASEDADAEELAEVAAAQAHSSASANLTDLIDPFGGALVWGELEFWISLFQLSFYMSGGPISGRSLSIDGATISARAAMFVGGFAGVGFTVDHVRPYVGARIGGMLAYGSGTSEDGAFDISGSGFTVGPAGGIEVVLGGPSNVILFAEVFAPLGPHHTGVAGMGGIGWLAGSSP